jgi:O-methyltransferase domain/Dimerisation domain
VASRVPPPPAVVAAVIGARRALLALADRLVPAEVAVFDQLVGTAVTQSMGALVELGVVDALAEGPATAAQLAGRLDLDADHLHRVLRAGAVLRLVRLDRTGRFSLTRNGRALATAGPTSASHFLRYFSLRSTTLAWAGLADAIRSGRPAFPDVHGMSVWAWFAQHPEEERTFAAAMRSLTEVDAPSIVHAYPWPERGVVCDVAGGVGTLLAAILDGRDGLRGVLVDGPGVLAEAESFLASRGLRERAELVEGDIFERVDASADIYLLKDVIHDWDDERSARILATIRATMAPGARLVLVETLQEPDEPHPVASLADVQMLTQTDGGRQRSAGELQALLRGAGLEPGEVRMTRTPGLALVEGVRLDGP